MINQTELENDYPKIFEKFRVNENFTENFKSPQNKWKLSFQLLLSHYCNHEIFR